MGRTVGSYEAKTHLPQLLESVSQGERITITRNGKPIALLVPPEPDRLGFEEVVGRMNEIRRGNTLEGVSLRQLIEEGRRF